MLGRTAQGRFRQFSFPLAIACLLLISGKRSLSAQTALSQMYHRSWTVRDGAPNDMNQVVRGSDGFLWLSTEDGLYRFDGLSFQRYQPPAGETMLSDRIYSIIASHDGAIWISYLLGGVARIQDGHIRNFTAADGLYPGHTGMLAEDKDGRVWVAGVGGLKFIQNGKVKGIEATDADNGNVADNLLVDGVGNLWVPKAEHGLWVLERRSGRFLAASRQSFWGCSLIHDADVLCVSQVGRPATRFNLANSKIVSRPMLNSHWVINDLLAARDGTIWMGIDERGIQRFVDQPQINPSRQPAGIESFDRGRGLSGERVENFLEDEEGSVWVVTNRGLDQFRSVPFQEIPLNSPHITLPANRVTPRFLIGTDRFAEVNGNRVSYFSHELDAPRSIYQSNDGTVWLGAWGLGRYRDGRMEIVPLPAPLEDDARAILTIVEDAAHGIWAQIGTSGLYRLDEHGWSKGGGLSGLPNNTASAALRDTRGDLWFGYRNNTLAHISHEHVSILTSVDGLNIGETRVLAERNAAIWVTGDQGIQVLAKGGFRAFRLDSGHRLRGVSGLVFLSNGDLWINSSSGVFQVTHDELANWDKDADHPVQARLFDYLDGVNGIPAMFSGYPSIAAAPDGTLYFANSLSLQRIDPFHIPKNQIVPRVWITKIGTPGGSIPVASSVRLKPDEKELDIQYTAPSLLIPERVRFRYQLVGYDKDWVDAGTRRQAFYARLPPRTYTFRVIACNDSGVWSTSAATITIVVPTTWMETTWFKLCMVLLALLLTYVGFQLRMKHLKRKLSNRLNERFAEREQIARDLHDNLFQGVEGGLLLINSVTSRIPMEPSAKEKLNDAFREVNLVMASARNLIFDRGRFAEQLDLEGIIELYGEEIGILSPTQFRVKVSGKKRAIKAEASEEILKVIKEALSNAFRHAMAKEIEVEIVYSSHGLEVCVCDDGIGISPSILEEGGKSGHWGIPSMRQRAEKAGGKLKLSRRRQGGTELSLKIPASQAFTSRVLELSASWFR